MQLDAVFVYSKVDPIVQISFLVPRGIKFLDIKIFSAFPEPVIVCIAVSVAVIIGK